MSRKSILCLLVTVTSVLLISGLSWGQCPGQPNDRGVCDTLYVEPYKYTGLGSFPADVEVAIRVTHDVPDPTKDSLSGMVIPLCFTSTNPAASVTIDAAKNACGAADLYPFPDVMLENSVFQHLPDMATASEHNWMMDLSAAYMGLEWTTRILNLTDQPDIFWLSLVTTGTSDQTFGEGSRVLIATMTLTIQDTTTICIDSCYWPPTGQLGFANYQTDGTTFIPRHNLPICFSPDTAVSEVREMPGSEDVRPSEFSLYQNYPNPFNPFTNIEFNVARSAQVKLDIFNIVGQRVRTLVDEEMEPGRYVADWDGKDQKGHSVSSGIYFYRMEAGDFSDMKKMLLVK